MGTMSIHPLLVTCTHCGLEGNCPSISTFKGSNWNNRLKWRRRWWRRRRWRDGMFCGFV